MAQLDRFLNLLVTNNGSALILAEGDVATVTIKDSARPVMKQQLTGTQILTLVREIAPPDKPHALDATGAVRFEYSSADGTFDVALTQTGKILARIEPKAVSTNGIKPNAAPAKAAAPQAVPPQAARPQAPAPQVAAARVEAANAGTPMTQARRVAATGNPAFDKIESLLRTLVGNKASDLHLRAGSPPLLRSSGEIAPIPNEPALSSDEIDAMLNTVKKSAPLPGSPEGPGRRSHFLR